jgi:hypothetical protein
MPPYGIRDYFNGIAYPPKAPGMAFVNAVW